MHQLASSLLREFSDIVKHDLLLPDEYREPYLSLCDHLSKYQLRSTKERRDWLIAHINRKFKLNATGLAQIYVLAASNGYTFNYHEKNLIQQAFDTSSKKAIDNFFYNRKIPTSIHQKLVDKFKPITEEETLYRFSEEIARPTKLRKEKKDTSLDRDILLAAFSAFLFGSTSTEVLHQFFDNTYTHGKYEISYWRQLRLNFPHLYNRDHALDIIRVTKNSETCYSQLRSRIFQLVKNSFTELNNHGYLAILIDPTHLESRFVSWELVSDLILYAEKHVDIKLKNSYFQHEKIQSATSAHIEGLNVSEAQFHLAHEGFSYRDTFILSPTSSSPMETAQLLVLFQKNLKDETPIPCPACRSSEINGNSYSSLGVRSWECKNLLCPDRSKYNRGKRYSFRSLLMQEAIDDERNEIPQDSVKKWMRDVQIGRTESEIIEFLVRHYSLTGDTIHLFGSKFPIAKGMYLNRKIILNVDTKIPTNKKNHDEFFDSSLFKKYLVRKTPPLSHEPTNTSSRGLMTLIHDDCFKYLSSVPEGFYDGAVTSPPYYNAREYSQWDNIYCYIYDMYNVGVELYRTLKPGAIFLYNIFDYFDNEKTIALSAMGQKRMILSAYMVDAFRRVGFVNLGNIAWDKGDIEGKRAFNAGNFSPYYQAPFNCWEHILIFQKPGGEKLDLNLPAILRAKPIIKIIQGENTFGHTAPYPEDIPALISTYISEGGRVIDPFGGSGTTARALCSRGIHTTCVEQNIDYYNLALKMGQESLARSNQKFFDF